jgi:hypothetical protein
MIFDSAKFVTQTLQAIDDLCVVREYPAQRRIEFTPNAAGLDAGIDAGDAGYVAAGSDFSTDAPVVISPESRLEVYANHLFDGTLSCMHLGILPPRIHLFVGTDD